MSETRPSAVEISDVVVRYGDVVAVNGVSLTVERGRHLALIGPSGCGKTTLLRAIAGFERPVGGTIRIGGAEASGPSAWLEPERRHVGMVFQQGALFPHMTVLENVSYGLARGSAGRAEEALVLVGLADMRHRHPDELSGGQQQRVALARALAPQPHVILLDEPFASLDAALRVRLRDEVAAILASTGMTSILVTHDREEAFAIADEIAVMDHGRLLQSGGAKQIYEEPLSREVSLITGAAFLIDCSVSQGRATTALGTVETDAPAGRGTLLVRPEDVLLANDGNGVSCEVVCHRFRGADVSCELRAAGVPDLALQMRPLDAPSVGTRVAIRLRDRVYRVYPA
ncbi:MAG: ABC transporter ATP-binding protein [Thermoanaerobaculia bacterium]